MKRVGSIRRQTITAAEKCKQGYRCTKGGAAKRRRTSKGQPGATEASTTKASTNKSQARRSNGKTGKDRAFYDVESFRSYDAEANLIDARWAGWACEGPWWEDPVDLFLSLGANVFKNLCQEALIPAETVIPADFAASSEDGPAAAVNALVEWYQTNVWANRRALAWCFVRGCRHLGRRTTGDSESRFSYLKMGAGPSKLIGTQRHLSNLAKVTLQQALARARRRNDAAMSEVRAVPESSIGLPGDLAVKFAAKARRALAEQCQLAFATGPTAYQIAQIDDLTWAVWRQDHSGRPRVVRVVDGCLQCSCPMWESHGYECRHQLLVHGAAGESSVALRWRLGVCLGHADRLVWSHHRAGAPRPLGPLFRGISSNMKLSESAPRGFQWSEKRRGERRWLVASAASSASAASAAPGGPGEGAGEGMIAPGTPPDYSPAPHSPPRPGSVSAPGAPDGGQLTPKLSRQIAVLQGALREPRLPTGAREAALAGLKELTAAALAAAASNVAPPTMLPLPGGGACNVSQGARGQRASPNSTARTPAFYEL